MNKIVCDVCGTSYPETTPQCPICGTAKTDTNKTTAGTSADYAYVKGGRFSHSNVRKRNAGNKDLPRVVAPVKSQKEDAPGKNEKTDEKTPKQTNANNGNPPSRPREKHRANGILMVISIVLVLAIIGACVLIVREYLTGNKPPVSYTPSTAPSTQQPSKVVPCTGLKLSKDQMEFTSVGQLLRLEVTRLPEDCTEKITYESSDPRIVVVNDIGIVTAIANGEATILIRCGNQETACTIVCNVGIDPVAPSGPSTQPAEPPVILELNRDEFTLKGYGSSHDLYSGELDPTLITWTTSDENVATVENGKVVAVGNGDAAITAEYMGQTATCIVHCEEVVITGYDLYNTYGNKVNDMTLSVGESVSVYLVDKESGLRVQSGITFRLSKEGVCTIDSKGKIKAVSKGTVTVYVEYQGETYKCIVRVKNAS